MQRCTVGSPHCILVQFRCGRNDQPQPQRTHLIVATEAARVDRGRTTRNSSIDDSGGPSTESTTIQKDTTSIAFNDPQTTTRSCPACSLSPHRPTRRHHHWNQPPFRDCPSIRFGVQCSGRPSHLGQASGSKRSTDVLLDGKHNLKTAIPTPYSTGHETSHQLPAFLANTQHRRMCTPANRVYS